jgi:DNA-binding helix-hairpin-helix protein with protein kinase domain
VRTFHDLQEREVGLGRCLGRGGEGAVYSVPIRPGFAAKIYARTPDGHTSRKLGAMVQLATEQLACFAAWPQNLLVDPRMGNVVGFLMPRVDGHREIHALYGPTDRKTAFPDASWAFLVRVARNVAAAFDTVHQHGHVIGDVNQGNVVVSRKATVRLIDCDSFQITHLGRTYPCRVGVPLFTPPELQGQRLEGVVRTPDHDRFGLAVLIFQLLFMGRHPFTGRHPERTVTVETAIREGLFVFGREATRQGWQPPPFSLRLRDIPAPLAHLFERAFAREATQGGPRPTAAEWAGALDALEARLVTCGDDPRHVHARVNGSCPWCLIEGDGGPSFFFLPPGAAPDAFDLAATWRAIEAVQSPGPAALPSPPAPVEPASPGLSTLVLQALRGLLGLLPSPGSDLGRVETERRARAIAAEEENLHRLGGQWESLCGDAGFAARRRDLEIAKVALEGRVTLEEREWAELTERFRQTQLPPHLRTFALEFARIPGLGPAELAHLASRGVTTAADITPERLMAIRGIDLDLVRGLLLFKGVATRTFTFEPVTGIPGKDRRALEDSQRKRRETLLKTLGAGPLELARLRRETLAWRDVLGRALDETHRRLAQLRAEARRA